MQVDIKVAAIASRQLGVFTRRQAEEAGATKGLIDHRLRTGRWVSVHRGVFRLRGTPRSREQAILSACLAGGEGAVASHWTAFQVWRFPNCRSPQRSSQIEITIPTSRRFRGPGIVVHQSNLSGNDVTYFGVIPTTSPFRTLLNLAGLAEEPIVFEVAFDDALRRDLLSPARLISQMASLEGSTIAGMRLLRSTVESRIGLGIPMSVLETHFVNLLDRYGLPQPIRQQRVVNGEELVGTVDFFYPGHNLIVECHGKAFHSTARDMERDLHRANEYMLGGKRLLSYSWLDVLARGQMVCGDIAQALGLSAKMVGTGY